LRTNNLPLYAMVGLFSVLPLRAAIAQNLAAETQTQEDGALQVEKIMVTAQKRGEDLQEVPLALSVLGNKELERGNLQSFQDLQYSVPNLSMVVTSPFATTVNMRGVPSSPNGVFNSGTSPGLGIYVDGVVYSRATGFNQDLSNIERVEVLRGPQGTLFGQNTNLGVVSITTKKPSEFTEAKVKLDVGNYNLRRVNAYASMPVIEDILAASITAFNVDRDGYIDNRADGQKLGTENRYGGRAQVRYTPTADLTIDINAEMSDGDSLPPVGRLTDYALGLGFLGLAAQGMTPEAHFSDDIRTVSVNSEDNFARRENWGIDSTVSYRFANGFELKSITAKKDYDAVIGLDTDNTSVAIFSSEEREDNKQFTQELQLISPDDQDFRYVAGLYYLNNEAENRQQFGTGSGIYFIPTGLPDGYPQNLNLLPGSAIVLDGTLETTSSAVFTNLSYDFSSAVNGFVGIRYSAVEKAMSFAQQGFATSLPGVYLLDYIDIPTTEQRFDDSFVSWTGGISGTVSSTVNVYAKVSRGFKEGGYSFRPQSTASIGGDPANPVMDFGREQVTSYEAGMKSDLLSRRLRLNMAVFYLDYEDIQTRVIDDNGVNRVINGPTATSQGLEAEIRYRLTPSLTISANLGYADAKFGDFANCHAVDDCTGNQLPGAATWTNAVALNYLASVADNWELFANADYSYRSEIQSDARNLTTTELDSSNLVNTQLGLVSDDGMWELMLWSKNLFDEETLVSRNDKATSDLSFSSELYAMPRTFGLSVTYSFY